MERKPKGGRRSRNKGAAFERHVACLFHEQLGIKPQRNLEQYRSRENADLMGIQGWTIECKHYATGNWFKGQWWEQTVAATPMGNTPALVWRFNFQPIRVTVPLRAFGADMPKSNHEIAVIDFDTLCFLIRESLTSTGQER